MSDYTDRLRRSGMRAKQLKHRLRTIGVSPADIQKSTTREELLDLLLFAPVPPACPHTALWAAFAAGVLVAVCCSGMASTCI